MSHPQKRKLKLTDADAVAAEVRRLRAGCQPAGTWTLAQICWHLNAVLTFSMAPGPYPTFDIAPGAKATLARILAQDEIPQIKAPERALPPATANAGDIDRLLQTLERFKTFPGPFAPHRLFGEIPTPDFIRLHLIHCSHHLAFLLPNSN